MYGALLLASFAGGCSSCQSMASAVDAGSDLAGGDLGQLDGAPSPPDGWPGGCLFGAHIKQYPNVDGGYYAAAGQQSTESAIAAMESRIGRTFAVDRLYYGLSDGGALDGTEMQDDAAHGRLSLVSLKPAGMWSQITDHTSDGEIDARAAEAKQFGHNFFLAFNHEADDDVCPKANCKGTASDFIAAWQYIYKRFADDGVTNVRWIWIVTSEHMREGKAQLLWPGDQYVEFVGFDGYNPYPCKASPTWTSFAAIFNDSPMDPMKGDRAFALAHNKRWIIAEFGTQEDAPCGFAPTDAGTTSAMTCPYAAAAACDSTCGPSSPPCDVTRKQQWFADALTKIKSWPDLVAVLYFHSDSSYKWWIDTPEYTDQSASFQGFKAMAADPYLNPPVTLP